MKSSRRAKLLGLIDSKPGVTFGELSEAFPDVSEMTLRRDVAEFEREGLLIRVRGGVRSMKYISSAAEGSIDDRIGINPVAKEKIAEKCAKLITAGSSVYIDAGTTALSLASAIPDMRLTVTTSGMNVALEFVKRDFAVVSIVGGIVNRDNLTVSGDSAMAFVSSINIETAFIVPAGVTDDGFFCGNLLFSGLKAAVLKRAKKRVILFDSSKVGVEFAYRFCGFEDVDIIVTDKPLVGKMAQLAKDNGITVILAD